MAKQPKKESGDAGIGADVDSEFSAMRRSNILANPESIVTDSRKESPPKNPLKAIKLIRMSDMTSDNLDLDAFPVLSRSASPAVTPQPRKRPAVDSPLFSQPMKLPKLIKLEDTARPIPKKLTLPNIPLKALKIFKSQSKSTPFSASMHIKPSTTTTPNEQALKDAEEMKMTNERIGTTARPKAKRAKIRIAWTEKDEKTPKETKQAESPKKVKTPEPEVVKEPEAPKDTTKTPLEEALEKVVEPSVEKNAEPSVDVPVEKSAEPSVETPIEKSTEPAAETPIEKSSEKKSDQDVQDVVDDESTSDVDVIMEDASIAERPQEASEPHQDTEYDATTEITIEVEQKKPKKSKQRRHLDESKPSGPEVVPIDDTQIKKLKTKIISKLMGRSQTEPYGLQDKISELEKLITSVVREGESHSCFIYGPKNSGKSAVLRSALHRCRASLDPGKDFLYIHVSGSAHETDKEAVRAIADQLDAEISRIYGVRLEDLAVGELLSRKSITNTFANVLKVLDDEVVLGADDSGKIRHPIVFCLDEMDVYANQSRQTLLYNLFDLAENSRTPVCVLCLTSKFTVGEMLEKRVRSRFSHRSIQLRKLSSDKFFDVCTRMLMIDEPVNDYERKWNEDVQLFSTGDSALRKLMLHNVITSGNLKDFANQMILPVAKLSVDEPLLVEEDLLKYYENNMKGSLRSLVTGMSDLERYLLVCSARVITKTDMAWVNLNIAYDEYASQLKAQQREVTSTTGFGAVATTGFKKWSKDACKHPWETLQKLGLLTVPGAGVGSRTDFANSTFETRMWQVELTLDELRLIVGENQALSSWTRL